MPLTTRGWAALPGIRRTMLALSCFALLAATPACASDTDSPDAQASTTAELSEADKMACEKVHEAYRDMTFAMMHYDTAVQKNGYENTDINDFYAVTNGISDYISAIRSRLQGRTNPQLIAAMNADLNSAEATLKNSGLDKVVSAPSPSHSAARSALANMSWQDRTGAVCGLAAK